MSDAVGTGRGDSVQAGARTPGHHPRDLVGAFAGNYKHTGAQTSRHETLIQNIQSSAPVVSCQRNEMNSIFVVVVVQFSILPSQLRSFRLMKYTELSKTFHLFPNTSVTFI